MFFNFQCLLLQILGFHQQRTVTIYARPVLDGSSDYGSFLPITYFTIFPSFFRMCLVHFKLVDWSGSSSPTTDLASSSATTTRFLILKGENIFLLIYTKRYVLICFVWHSKCERISFYCHFPLLKNKNKMDRSNFHFPY